MRSHAIWLRQTEQSVIIDFARFFANVKFMRILERLALLYFLRYVSFFFFNDPAPPEISPLSLHDALPISSRCPASSCSRGRIVVPGAQASPAGSGSFSSTTATIGLTPSAAIWRDTIAGSSGPSKGWPPVIATASL